MIDVTPEERQRVAERLRGKGHMLMPIDRAERELALVVSALVPEGTRWDGGTYLGILADLIDPTCEAEPVDGFPGRYRCSACHTVWTVLSEAWYRHCPCCGARVIRKEETNETQGA